MPESDTRLRGLIADYLLGELSPESEAEVRDMLDRDPESKEIVELSRTLRDEVARREAGHPPSELLAGYVVDRRALGPEQVRELEEHLRDCPDCREEREKLERALTPRPLDRVLRNSQGRPAWGRLALAALFLICIVPVWMMLVEPAPEILPQSSLRLEGAFRAEETAPPATAPAKTLLLSLAHDPWSLPEAGPDPRLDLSLYRDDDRAPIWSKSIPANELRNPSGGGLLLELPAESLPRGEYRLEIREGNPPELGFVGRFLIR